MSVISRKSWFRRSLQLGLLGILLLVLMGDESARVNDLGHRLMCACGCNQILLECNHVGCSYSDRMRAELVAAVDRGDNDDLTLQSFVQKDGPTVLGLVSFIVRAWKSRPLILPAGLPAPIQGAELDQFRTQARKETEL
jgi:cytochrome c-type biogenesis protein CcmH